MRCFFASGDSILDVLDVFCLAPGWEEFAMELNRTRLHCSASRPMSFLGFRIVVFFVPANR